MSPGARLPPLCRAFHAIPLLDLQTPDDLRDIAISSDCHYGGLSNMTLEMNHDEGEGRGVARFHGRLRTALSPFGKSLGLERSGYASFRTIQRRSLWGKEMQDLSMHSHIRVRARNNMVTGGEQLKFYVNLQTESYSPTDIYQHPLALRRRHVWEDILLPLQNFVWIILGKPAQNQRTPTTDMLTTIGVSVLAPPSGRFDVSLSHIDLINLPAPSRITSQPTEAAMKSWEGDPRRGGDVYKLVGKPGEESWKGLDDEIMWEIRLQEEEQEENAPMLPKKTTTMLPLEKQNAKPSTPTEGRKK
ncbi:hypothetical protein BT69DRAFT_1338853 [Atractiella rhizophila]|nr:hypothetical protein BT69DRAFT_1338853 [Atractiella rhizophila]